MTPSPIAARVIGPFQRFFSTEAAGGIVLLACAAIALVWANSTWANAYRQLWETPLGLETRSFGLSLTLHEWVNDGLMAAFFFFVGLEIKREVLIGELSSRRSAALPVAAAIGGMVVPAAIYAIVNRGGAGAHGWGVPMATDIAFALGVLALFGNGLPSGLRVFLAALAIVDDLGAVLVIALFYTNSLHWGALGGAAAVVAVLVGANFAGVGRTLVYVALGVILWFFVLFSGIHATVAGVLLALTIPARAHTGTETAPSLLQRLESALQGPVAFLIMPVFALANAGIPLGAGAIGAVRTPVALGVILGLLFGKPIGIMLASIAAVRAGAAELPSGVTWRQVHGASWLGGIGFTMSLFIAGLAFADAAMLDVAKLGVIAASACAGATGYFLLRATRARV
jgi:NhaA family Na+:H+ antiporter